MARSANNLNAVLQDTADAIKAKKSSSAKICPRDFADEIASISSGNVSSAQCISLGVVSDEWDESTGLAYSESSIGDNSTVTIKCSNTFGVGYYGGVIPVDCEISGDYSAYISSVSGDYVDLSCSTPPEITFQNVNSVDSSVDYASGIAASDHWITFKENSGSLEMVLWAVVTGTVSITPPKIILFNSDISEEDAVQWFDDHFTNGLICRDATGRVLYTFHGSDLTLYITSGS